MTLTMEPLRWPGHEEVWRVSDPEAGLLAHVAIHSTLAGPAVGGLRMYPHASEEAALTDALRLSRAMTFKNAAAGLPLGGGKAVIMGDPRRDKTPALLRAMGRAIDRLGGRYVTAEDMGTGPADMAVIREETRWVAGLAEGPFASGDPSPVTARGVFNAMVVTARHRFGDGLLAGRTVAVQGLGHVGRALARHLHDAGAGLIVTDLDPARVAEAARAFGAEPVAPEQITRVPADIFAPCAMGGVLDATACRLLKAAAVVGAANNQLASDDAARCLHARGVVHAPDFVANAGGIINAATEILRIADRAGFVEAKLNHVARVLDEILALAARRDTSPHFVAEEVISARLGGRTAA